MASDVTEPVRRQVIERAHHHCEYCRIHEDSAGFMHQIDHIVSRKHGGSSEIDNLAYACVLCNRYKGTDIAALSRAGTPVRLFNPRRDSWDEHFLLRGPVIEPLTPVGEVTARTLRFNAVERVLERRLLQSIGTYPKQ